MPKLVNLKLSAADQKKQMEPATADADRARYPYGLTIHLDTDTLEKLGIKTLPDVGDEVLLIAQADVTNISSTEGEGGKSRSVGLQITDLCLEDGDDEDAAAIAAKLYDKE